MFVSHRREKRIDRAAKLRTMSRKTSYTPDPDSRWRAAYAARMEDSMRRTQQAADRSKVAAGGPSFVERQDKEFAAAAEAQVHASASGKLSPDVDMLEPEDSWHNSRCVVLLRLCSCTALL